MRERLDNRRASDTIDLVYVRPDGARAEYRATLGFYNDGRLGEVFLTATKVGTEVDVAVREAAILLSFALQHGCTVAPIRAAMIRNAEGKAEGVMGTLLDLIDEGEGM